MDDFESKSGGMFASVRRIRDSVLGLLQTRVELAVLELQEEKLRLFDVLLRAAVFVVLSIIALMAATALVVVMLWDYSPVLILGAVTTLYGAAAVGVWWDLRKRINQAPPPFEQTLVEFKKDTEGWQDKS